MVSSFPYGSSTTPSQSHGYSDFCLFPVKFLLLSWLLFSQVYVVLISLVKFIVVLSKSCRFESIVVSFFSGRCGFLVYMYFWIMCLLLFISLILRLLWFLSICRFLRGWDYSRFCWFTSFFIGFHFDVGFVSFMSFQVLIIWPFSDL